MAFRFFLLDLPDTYAHCHDDHVHDVRSFNSRGDQILAGNCVDFPDRNTDLQISGSENTCRSPVERQAVSELVKNLAWRTRVMGVTFISHQRVELPLHLSERVLRVCNPDDG